MNTNDTVMLNMLLMAKGQALLPSNKSDTDYMLWNLNEYQQWVIIKKIEKIEYWKLGEERVDSNQMLEIRIEKKSK